MSLILPIMLAPDAAYVSKQSKALAVTFITQTFVILASLLQGDGVEFISEVSSFSLIHLCTDVARFLFPPLDSKLLSTSCVTVGGHI